MRILGVSGSLRESSYNTSLLRAAAEAAPEGVELELWEGLAELPLYDEELDGEHAPEPVRRLREAWGEADAILFATPEYNGSVPGGLKNAIDWASRPVKIEATVSEPNVDPFGRERVGIALEAKVDRTEFGMSWNAPNQGGGNYLGDDVTITADLALVKAAS